MKFKNTAISKFCSPLLYILFVSPLLISCRKENAEIIDAPNPVRDSIQRAFQDQTYVFTDIKDENGDDLTWKFRYSADDTYRYLKNPGWGTTVKIDQGALRVQGYPNWEIESRWYLLGSYNHYHPIQWGITIGVPLLIPKENDSTGTYEIYHFSNNLGVNENAFKFDTATKILTLIYPDDSTHMVYHFTLSPKK